MSNITLELSEAEMSLIEDAFFAAVDSEWRKAHWDALCGIWKKLCEAMEKEKKG